MTSLGSPGLAAERNRLECPMQIHHCIEALGRIEDPEYRRIDLFIHEFANGLRQRVLQTKRQGVFAGLQVAVEADACSQAPVRLDIQSLAQQ